MKNKSILLVGPYPPAIGGVASFINKLVNSPLNKKYKFILFKTNKKVIEGKNNMLKFVVLIFQKIKLFLLLPITIKKEKPDIIQLHCNSIGISFLIEFIYVLISKIFGKKIIVRFGSGHSEKFFKNKNIFKSILFTLYFKGIDKIIVQSEYWNKIYLNFANKNKIVIIPNWVDPHIYKKGKIEKEEKDGIYILFIDGFGGKEKGAYDIANMLNLFSEKEIKNMRFVCIASTAEFKNYCVKNDVDKYIIFYPSLIGKEKINIFSAVDIFVLPTYAEGFPNSIIESMSLELPVISTPAGAIPEIIEDGENGFLIKPGDIDALKEKILELANNKKLREEIGKRNRELVKEKYSWDVIAERIMEVYDETLKES